MITQYIEELIELNKKVLSDEKIIKSINQSIKLILDSIFSGGKLLIAGNGGSAADAQHFAAEIVGRYKINRRGYPAISLVTDTSILTAIANDYGFENVFSRQIEALSESKDIFFGISTSGNSLNIIEAVKKAKENNLKVICLLGNKGGKLLELSDISIVVPSENTPRIQEIHAMIIHIICEELEKELIK